MPTLAPPPVATHIVLECAGCRVRLELPVRDAAHAARVRCPACRATFPLRAVRGAGTTGSGDGLEAAPAPAPQLRWEVGKPGYEGTPLDSAEMRLLIRNGDLRDHDPVRPAGPDADWQPAGTDAALQSAFSLRQKEISARLASLLRRKPHRCIRHANQRAPLVCLQCAVPLCSACGDAATRDGKPCCADCGSELATL